MPEIRAFLSPLAREKNVAASTQNVAFNALRFFYKDVLKIPLPEITGGERVQRSRRLPNVPSQDETRRLLECKSGTPRLMAQMLYGAGLRMSDLLEGRVKDVDLDRNAITVRESKGVKDRRTMLPQSLCEPVRGQLDAVRILHEHDRRAELPVSRRVSVCTGSTRPL